MSISEQYVDGHYAQNNPTYHTEDSLWKAEQILTAWRRSGIEPQSVVEVGCGAGEILVQLRARVPAATYVGHEFSPQAFAMCQSRGAPGLTFYDTDFFDTDSVFDMVMCVDVIEHVEDPFSFLRKLKPRGRHFLFHIPLDMNAQMVLRGTPISRVRQQVGHLHYFTKDTALALLKDCGFEVQDWFFTPNAVDRPKSWRSRVAKWPRKLAACFGQEWTARVLGGYSLMVTAR